MKTRSGENDARRGFDAIQNDDDSKQRYVGILVKQCVAYVSVWAHLGLDVRLRARCRRPALPAGTQLYKATTRGGLGWTTLCLSTRP